MKLGTESDVDGVTCPSCGGSGKMVVRGKVRCSNKTDNEVHFEMVYEPDGSKNDENVRFTKATPWGSIKLDIDNKSALDQFEEGKEYYVDFTSAKA